jgi:hypothetical protein
MSSIFVGLKLTPLFLTQEEARFEFLLRFHTPL